MQDHRCSSFSTLRTLSTEQRRLLVTGRCPRRRQLRRPRRARLGQRRPGPLRRTAAGPTCNAIPFGIGGHTCSRRAGTSLIIGGATSAGSDGAQERYETELLDVGSGESRHVGPPGLRPAHGPSTWLPDDSLVAYRLTGALGGDPGIYLVRPDGSARMALSSGTPLGVIAG
jgi:hypothetical protein